MASRCYVAGVALVIFLLACLCWGCGAQRKPEPEVRKPAIPQAISRGEGKEPRLGVYVVETGEVRDMLLEEYVAAVVAGEMKKLVPP